MASQAFGVALQLYTVRQQFEQDPQRCLADVAAAGYRAVEFAGFAEVAPARLRRWLDDGGLAAVSSHVDIPEFDAIGRVVDDHQTLGCESVVIQQAASSDFIDVASVSALAHRCNEWGTTLLAAGMRLGYHGYHDFAREFAMVDGVTMFDRLVQETDPDVFDLQLDTYWVSYVGDDPVAALERYRGRVPMLHLKEVAEDTDAPLGQGSTDWPAVLSAAEATGVHWLVVEQESHPESAPQNIRLSLAYLRSLLHSRGVRVR